MPPILEGDLLAFEQLESELRGKLLPRWRRAGAGKIKRDERRDLPRHVALKAVKEKGKKSKEGGVTHAHTHARLCVSGSDTGADVQRAIERQQRGEDGSCAVEKVDRRAEMAKNVWILVLNP